MLQQFNTAHPNPQVAQQLMRLREALERPYLFIHVNKCGGSSVAAALDMVQFHGSVRSLIKTFGRDFILSKRSFSVVRRPYERLCSLYRYRRKRGEAEANGRVLDLNEWVFRTFQLKDPALAVSPKMLKPAHEWMVDAEGENLVSLIVKLEEIDKGWGEIQQLTGSTAALPRVNTTQPTPDTSVPALSGESRAIIEDIFQADFEAYGYDRI